MHTQCKYHAEILQICMNRSCQDITMNVNNINNAKFNGFNEFNHSNYFNKLNNFINFNWLNERQGLKERQARASADA